MIAAGHFHVRLGIRNDRVRLRFAAGPGVHDVRVRVGHVERADLPGALQHKAVRLGRWKLVRRYTLVASEARIAGEELYDLEHDPFEEHDLFAAPPKEAPLARLEAELLRFAAADVHFADLARKLAAERAALDPESRRILEALGY